MTSTLFFSLEEKKLDSVLEQSSRILIHYHLVFWVGLQGINILLLFL